MDSTGRPSKYKPEYCQRLIDHMASGLSFESFAGLVGTCKDTIYEWANAHSLFSEAKKEGFERNRLFWERAALKGMTADKFNATVWIFNMKNRFPREWRDRTEVDSTSTTNIVLDTSDKSKLMEIVKAAREEKEGK